MSKSTIPTIVALCFLVVATAFVIFLLNEKQLFQSNANLGALVQDVRITNVKDTSFTVSYRSFSPTSGIVKYSSNLETLQTSPGYSSKIHWINITNAKANTIYSIEVEGVPEGQVQTLASYIPGDKIISGTILKEKTFPAANVLVYAAVEGVITSSAFTSPAGTWVITLPEIPQTSILQIMAVDANGNQASAWVPLSAANPVADMVLGKTYDLRNEPSGQSDAAPTLPLQLP